MNEGKTVRKKILRLSFIIIFVFLLFDIRVSQVVAFASVHDGWCFLKPSLQLCMSGISLSSSFRPIENMVANMSRNTFFIWFQDVMHEYIHQLFIDSVAPHTKRWKFRWRYATYNIRYDVVKWEATINYVVLQRIYRRGFQLPNVTHFVVVFSFLSISMLFSSVPSSKTINTDERIGWLESAPLSHFDKVKKWF